MARTNNNPPQNDHGGKKPRGDAEMALQACKICGEIGHTLGNVMNSALTMIRAIQLRNVPWPRLLVSYAMEPIMFLLNVTFTPWCND
jgi:hypothetical protein